MKQMAELFEESISHLLQENSLQLIVSEVKEKSNSNTEGGDNRQGEPICTDIHAVVAYCQAHSKRMVCFLSDSLSHNAELSHCCNRKSESALCTCRS